MSGGKYFLQLTGAVLLGLATLAIAALIVIFAAPYIMPVFMFLAPYVAGFILLFVIVIILWIVLYIAAMIGVSLYYIFKPMKVNENSGDYSISKVKESGRREEGDSDGKKKSEEEE